MSKSSVTEDRSYHARLTEILRLLHEAEDFDEALPGLEARILDLLGAERMTIYRRCPETHAIVSRHKTGDEVKEIRVPIAPRSIAGFVAMSRRPVRVDDVYEMGALRGIHPELRFDSSFDQRTGFRTRSMVVVPILSKDTLLGVLQVINRRGGGAFADQHLHQARELAQFVGHKFRYDFHGTQGPYNHLVQSGRITAEQLKDITERAPKEKTTVAQLLAREASIEPEAIGASLERYFQVRFMQYDAGIVPPPGLAAKVNASFLRYNCMVPLADPSSERLVLLTEDPNNAGQLMAVRQALGVTDCEVRVGLREDILRYLGYHLESNESKLELEDLVSRMEDGDEATVEAEADDTSIDSAALNEDAPTVVQLVNRLIMDAHRLGASDIHVEPGRDKAPATVRMRVDGVCRKVLNVPAAHVAAVVARIKVMSRLDISERRKPQDGKFAVKLRGQPLEVRVATLPTVNGENAVLRLLASGGPLSFDKLQLAERNRRELATLAAHPHGLLLVVGPTGSGKTTTLHSVLATLNNPERKIWTAEDPVEITQPGLQQVQVHPKIGFDFAAALRAFLRADPDVILIGEIRDRETAHAGVEASLTGHLVLSTLHTNSAPETVSRLLDLGLDPVSFSDALLGVLAQRLMRTLCVDCKEPGDLTTSERAFVARHMGEDHLTRAAASDEGVRVFRAVGCESCGGTGYRGRVGVHELLVNSEALRALIYRQAAVDEIERQAVADGMRTVLQDGIVKVLSGLSDFEQLRRVVAG